MKIKKRISIICLMLCFVLLLASCNRMNPGTDVGKAPEASSYNESIEEDSKTEESIADEESSEAEPAYQVEITEEMMKEYLKFRKVGFTLEELLENYEDVYGVENYNYKADCIALGELNGYTMWVMLPGIAKGYIGGRNSNYVIGDYSVICLNPDMPVYYCLYKDNVFISLRDAYAQGLINPDDAYALIKKDPRFEDTVKKLSEFDYQFEMTEEMANEYLRFTGSKYTIAELIEFYKDDEYMKNYNYKDDYHAIGNLNGYTFCFIPDTFYSCFGVCGFCRYSIEDYDFTTGRSGKSKACLYLYKDNTFITIEDAHERDLFDVAEAYEMFYDSGCSYARLEAEIEEDRKKIPPKVYDYEVKFTEEMANEFLKFNGIDESITELTARIREAEKYMDLKMEYNYRDFYKPFGNLNGYTLCKISPSMYYHLKAFKNETRIIGDYKFPYCSLGFKSDLDFYLYKDHTYITLEDAFEQGIVTTDEVYKRLRMSEYYDIMQKLEYENLDYQADMHYFMIGDFLKYNEVEANYEKLMKKLKKNDAMKDYDCNDDYKAVGNLNGYTLCFVYPGFCGLPVKAESGKFVAGDYEFVSGATGLKSCVNLYLYGHNHLETNIDFISFEEAYERGLFDVEDAYELLCSAGYSDCVKKLK